jgi:hypothetical protein
MSEKNPQPIDPLTRSEYGRYGGTVVGESPLAGYTCDSDPATSSTETVTPIATDEPTTTESSSDAVQIGPDQRERRDHEGQRRLLDDLDDDVIREYADTIATTERS